ncbi:MAG: carboxypeptidase M32 [Bacteroidota bacterium]|nr:carboxypeptidase M32 [Bacteroidota bacterium]MDP4210982.1 carboxypeptidase M32 [Bacteroidota bacterium]MDP4248796.1 carboxypeptidase M32 [Bacteroidota bacterium]
MLKIHSDKEQYAAYREHMTRLADIRNALALMQWDQETYMPAKGAGFRAQQIATLSELAHSMATSEKLEGLLKSLKDAPGLSETERKNITLNAADFEKQKKYSAAFVRKMSETISRSFNAWIAAKRENRFSLFEKDLDELILLKKEETAIVGFTDHPYDALLDEFEKGCTVKLLDKIFHDLKPRLQELIELIGQTKQVDNSFLLKKYDKQKQWDFGMKIIRDLGFDFEAGRQDLSAHPFTTSFNKNDVRITTRIQENDFNNMTWSCIHETGHALYEQGLPESEYGLPSGEFASLGVHESQSRLWENHVGRSAGFWKFHYPALVVQFPEVLHQISREAFYAGINMVKPSLIRTEADEVTYHFHVMIRYEIEKMLIAGELKTADIPVCWNEQYQKYLGIAVPGDQQGCLQDVHWSHGSFGYFPTYSLGSFYAAQLYCKAQKDLPEMEREIESGQTSGLLQWLRQRVHAHGRTYTSEELCEKATGETLNVQYFLDYILDKYRKIYQF